MPQDSTLFLLLKERDAEIWERKLNWLCRHDGMVLMNVHPDYVRFPGNPIARHTFPSRLFEDFLRKVSTEYRGQYWNPKPGELAAWYSQTLSVGESKPPISSRSNPLPEAKKATLAGKRAAVVLYSYYPSDPRPRRAAESMIQAGNERGSLLPAGNQKRITARDNQWSQSSATAHGKETREKVAYVLQYLRFLIACLLILGRQTLSENMTLCTCIICQTFWHSVR